MNINLIVLLGLAVLTANFPFLTDKLFALVRVGKQGKKSIWIRLAELLFWYGVFIGVGNLLEMNAYNYITKGWQFYAITLCLFLVFAFPGFVYRYLTKQH